MVDCESRIDVEASKADGELLAGSFSLHTPAFAVVDVTSLWLTPTYRGEDLLVPGIDGRMPLPRRRDVTSRSLPMVVDGRVDLEGEPWPDPRYGLRANIQAIRVGTNEPDHGEWTLTAPGDLGADRTATCRVVGIQSGTRAGSLWSVILDIEMPDGGFY